MLTATRRDARRSGEGPRVGNPQVEGGRKESLPEKARQDPMGRLRPDSSPVLVGSSLSRHGDENPAAGPPCPQPGNAPRPIRSPRTSPAGVCVSYRWNHTAHALVYLLLSLGTLTVTRVARDTGTRFVSLAGAVPWSGVCLSPALTDLWGYDEEGCDDRSHRCAWRRGVLGSYGRSSSSSGRCHRAPRGLEHLRSSPDAPASSTGIWPCLLF